MLGLENVTRSAYVYYYAAPQSGERPLCAARDAM